MSNIANNLKNVNNVKASFDTVSLNYSLILNNLNSFDNFITDYTVFDSFSKIKNELDKNTQKVHTVKSNIYVLSEYIKKQTVGLEHLKVIETIITYDVFNVSRSLDLNIVFNAKALKYDYLQNITKSNYDIVVKYFISNLSKYCKISDVILYNCDVRTLDYTKNIITDKYSIQEVLRTLSSITTYSRTLKRIHKDFIDDNTLYFHTSQKSKDKLYSKYYDLKKLSEDKKYINFKEYADNILVANKDNILRYEITFNKHKMIKNYFDVKSDENNKIKFIDLLNSTNNVVYNRFNKYYEKKSHKELFKMFDNDLSIDRFKNVKDYDKYLLGMSLFLKYKDDYSLMKKDIYRLSSSKTRQAGYGLYKKHEQALLFYKSHSESEINYIDCFNDFTNKLKNIDKHCI